MQPFSGVDTSSLLMTGMRLSQENHRYIANNIANADTPGYNPVVMNFEATLRSAIEGRGRISLRETRPQHFDRRRMRPEMEAIVFSSKNDYNKVDIDQEIANLSKNSGRYNVFGSLLVKQFQMIKSMLQDAR